MRIGVMTICYNEEQLLPSCLLNWRGKVSRHVVFHTDKPWHGQELPHDRSQRLCEYTGTPFVRLPWRSETEQRNWALGYFHDFDYVLVIDADELLTQEDQKTLLERVGNPQDFEDNQNVYRAERLQTYFKTPEYVLDPPDRHKPVIAISPKKGLFTDCRIPNTDYAPIVPVTVHHLTYLREPMRLFHKLKQFEHHDQVKEGWFENVFSKWTPEADDVRAYGQEKSKAVEKPMPEELKKLLEEGQKLLSVV